MPTSGQVVELAREGNEIAEECARLGGNAPAVQKYLSKRFPAWLEKVRKADSSELLELSGYFAPYGAASAYLESLRSAVFGELSSKATGQIVHTMVQLDKTGARLTKASVFLAFMSLVATIVIGWSSLQSLWRLVGAR